MAILVEINDKIATITLNRPEKHNAFNAEMLQELIVNLKLIEQNTQVNVLIFKANGKNFCSGADLQWMQKSTELSEEENYEDALQLADFFRQLYYLDKPTIAAVKGKTYGGGLGIISCCDFVIAETNASFAFSEVKLGLVASTIAPYVLQAIGIRQAKRYLLTAEIFSSRQALAMQLIHEIVEPSQLDDFAEQVAGKIINNSSSAIKECKQLLNSLAPINQEVYEQSACLIARLRVSQDAKERIRQFFEK